MSKYFDDKNNIFMAPQITQENSHMIMTNVHKNTKTKFINIDTRFQDEKSQESCSDNSLIISLPEYIKNVESLKVVSAEIPFSFYNFSSQRKNTYLKINATIITIPEGDYTYSELIDNLNDEISSNFSSDVIFEDVGDYKLLLKNDSSTIDIEVEFNINLDGTYDKNNVKSKLGWMLGFRKTNYSISSGSSILNESIAMVNNLNYILISIDDFNNTNPNSFIAPSSTSLFDSNIISRIPIEKKVLGDMLIATEPRGNLITDTRKYGDKTDLQRLKIKLFDNTGSTINLNNVDYSFCLEIKYK